MPVAPESHRETLTGGKRPAIPPGIKEVFFPFREAGPVIYQPRLIGAATIRFADAKLGIDQTREALLQAPFPDGISGAQWTEVCDVDPAELEKEPADDAQFSDVPNSALQPKNYVNWQKDFLQGILATQRLRIFRCPSLKAVAKPGESEAEFRASIALAARESRDAAVEMLRKKYAPKLVALQARLARAEAAVAKQKEQASHARIQTAISVGSTLLGAILGRKTLSSATLSKAATAARGVGRSMQEGSEAATAEQNAEAIRKQIAEMETEVEAESAALAATEPKIDVVEVKPARAAVSVRLIALGWIPKTS
jgi:hypothetical protein